MTESESTVMPWEPSAAARYNGDRECQYEDCDAEADFFVEFEASGYTGGRGRLCCKTCGRENRLHPEGNGLTSVPLSEKMVGALPEDITEQLEGMNDG